MLRHMFGGCMPPWLEDELVDTPDQDMVSVTILAGMAKTGDSTATIKKNIDVARKYSKSLHTQWSIEAGHRKRLDEIKSKKETIERHSASIEKNRVSLKAHIAKEKELTILIETVVPCGQKPQSKQAKKMVEDRRDAEFRITQFQDTIKDQVTQRRRFNKQLRELELAVLKK